MKTASGGMEGAPQVTQNPGPNSTHMKKGLHECILHGKISKNHQPRKGGRYGISQVAQLKDDLATCLDIVTVDIT